MFQTERLILRNTDPEIDFNLVLRGQNNPDYLSLVNHRPPVPLSIDSAKAWLRPRTLDELPKLAICEKPTSSDGIPLSAEDLWPNNLKPGDDYFKCAPPAIGFVNFQGQDLDYRSRIAWIGMGIADERNRGKGYGREVLLWALRYVFEELGLHKLCLGVYSHNVGAIKLYEKVGFVHEGRQRKTQFKGGIWYDSILMGVLEEEWFELKKKLPHAAKPNTD